MRQKLKKTEQLFRKLSTSGKIMIGMLTMNETPAFFKTSAKLLAGFDCIRRLRGIMTSLMLGMAKSQIDKPSLVRSDRAKGLQDLTAVDP
jgi:hypothetical protein